MHGDTYVLITWPESQTYMDTPGAFLIVDPDIAGPSAYMVPADQINAKDNLVMVKTVVTDEDGNEHIYNLEFNATFDHVDDRREICVDIGRGLAAGHSWSPDTPMKIFYRAPGNSWEQIDEVS